MHTHANTVRTCMMKRTHTHTHTHTNTHTERERERIEKGRALAQIAFTLFHPSPSKRTDIMADKKVELESQVGLTGHDEGGQSAAALAKPNSFTYIAILVAMMGAMMFGLDQGNFGKSFCLAEQAACVHISLSCASEARRVPSAGMTVIRAQNRRRGLLLCAIRQRAKQRCRSAALGTRESCVSLQMDRRVWGFSRGPHLALQRMAEPILTLRAHSHFSPRIAHHHR